MERPPVAPIVVSDIGTTAYADAHARMSDFVCARIAARTAARETALADEIWLTEHDPVFTLGRNGNRAHLRDAGMIPVVPTRRGGEITYHGPGQIVAYLMIDLPVRRLGVRRLVDAIEGALIATLADLGIESRRRNGAPGIYLTGSGEKIASIGLKVSRGISWHGLALNADMDLSPFERIDPCGYPGLRMTDIRTQAGAGAAPVDLKALRVAVADHLVAAIDR